MNINALFQFLWKNFGDVVAITISLISLAISSRRFLSSSSDSPSQEKRGPSRALRKIWNIRYNIFHILVLGCLTLYILANWAECISMQFFSQFDGNNILFLVWIILIFLLIYEVEGKGIKVAQRKHEQTQQSLDEVNWKYRLDTMLEQVKKNEPNANDSHREAKGGQ